jgi:integrase
VRHVAHPRHPLTGKQFRVSARTEAELARLLEAIDRMRGELRVGLVNEAEVDRKLRRVRYGTVALSRVLESYARRKDLSPDTIRTARTALRGPLRQISEVGIDDLDVPLLAPLFERVASTHSKSSVTTTWKVLRALLGHATERGWIARVPWGAWRPRAGRGRPAKPLRECCRDPEERARLVAAAAELDAEDLAGGRGYRALAAKVGAAALLGLRQGEVAGLRTYDLYPARGVVGVRRQWDGDPLKGSTRGADLAAPPELFTLLEAHLERTGARAARKSDRSSSDRLGRAVFESSAGGHYLRGSKPISLPALREVVRRAGLPSPERWTAHSLRDSFVTIEYQALGGDLAALMRRSRHATLTSLVRYLRSFAREPLAVGPAPPSGPRLLPSK